MGGFAQQFSSIQSQVQGATQWGGLGTLLGAGGDLLKGVGSAEQYSFLADQATRNAAIMRANAAATTEAGNYTASGLKLRTSQTIGEQRAAQGANGVDVNVGSPVAVRESTRTVGDLDAALAKYNADRSAFSQGLQAGALDSQAAVDRRAANGALTSGLLGASSTLLGGASSLASKWSQFTAAGAGTKVPVPTPASVINPDTGSGI